MDFFKEVNALPHLSKLLILCGILSVVASLGGVGQKLPSLESVRLSHLAELNSIGKVELKALVEFLIHCV